MIRIVQGERRYRVASYILQVPEVGPWDATVRVETITPGPTAGRVTLTDETTSWDGYARAVTPDGSLTTLDIVGGAGALAVATTARHWAASIPVASALSTLCGEAGEAPGADDGATLASWRARGASLELEVARLATWASGGAWHVGPDGLVTVAARTWPDAGAPGRLLDVAHGAIRHECPDLRELTGRTVSGRRIGTALYVSSGEGVATVDTWEARATHGRGTRGICGAVVEAQTDGRVDLLLDDGSAMGDVPLWAAPGVRAIVVSGARVLVVDLADDPRGAFALSGPWDADVEELLLADGGGRVIRENDLIMLTVNSGPPVPTPVTFAPSYQSAGAPGTGWSRVKA